MRQRLVTILKRWPGLYRFVARVYYALDPVHIAEVFAGTKAREKQWARRKKAMGYWGGWEHPSKRFLVERIARQQPFDSVLEIGCASGANLYLLSKEYPGTRMVGIDINEEAIEYGKARLAEKGVTGIQLLTRKASEIAEFGDKSFDIVFTSAVLIYIGPDKIREVIKDMLRVTRKALILTELHCFTAGKDRHGLGYYSGGTWVRDYAALLGQYVRAEQIRVTKIPKNAWPEEPWAELGASIEVIR